MSEIIDHQNGIDPQGMSEGYVPHGPEGAQANPEQPEDPIETIIRGVDREALDEDLLEDLVDRHPLAQEKAAYLRELRKDKQHSIIEEAQQITDIRETRKNIAQQIKTKLGVVEQNPSDSARRAEAERLQKLSQILLSLTHNETEDELMTKFGLVDEEGRITEEAMHSPLFKSDTSAAFGTYLSFVSKFQALEEAEAMSGIKMAGIQNASNLRGEAHNAVAHLVERDLGLPFDQARRFVAKAREAKIPQSHEKKSYAELLEGSLIATQFNHDAAAFTREALRDVIGRPMAHEQEESDS